MTIKPTNRRFVSDFFSMLFVSGLSLFLLIYIGFGEAQRAFEQLQHEKLMAQGEIIQNTMEKVLRPGVPLKQYVGFNTLCERILASDESISVIIAHDPDGNPVFTSGDQLVPLLSSSTLQPDDNGLDELSDRYLQVQLPLNNRFEQIGSLSLTIPKATITKKIQDCFKPLLVIGALLSLVFSLFIALFRPRLKKRKSPWLKISFGATFLAMSIVIVFSIVGLYSDGAQAKTRALADSLGYRLADIVSFNLVINDITGLDQLFADYQRLNPDIEAAALIINDKVAIHTDPDQVGQPWTQAKTSYEYIVDLTPPGSVREIRTAVALPYDIVYKRTLRSVKNFAALFVASAFLAGLFLQLASSLPNQQIAENAPAAETLETEKRLLDLVKPVFFAAVFIEHLTYSFLPQYIDQIVMQDNLSSSYLSAPFIIFYLFFALSLVPAGHAAERISPQRLMYSGLVLSAAGLSMLALSSDIWMVILARAVSGLGQGILFIGVQTYILSNASPNRRTQGVSIIVFGFQGGMISGLTIGSLLVPYLGAQGVFLLCGAIGISMTFYVLSVVPATRNLATTSTSLSSTIQELGKNMALVSRNMNFFKTMALVGIPAKMVLTGVIIFALPLLLAQKDYQQEDIGQIIMIYGACVLISTHYISRWVDRVGRSHIVLFWGTMISGLGISLIGMIDWEGYTRFANPETLSTTILIIGVAITGLAHGLINAPVVTHIAHSPLAEQIGASTATATYRFMERIGHIAGPVLIGQLFVFSGQNASMLAWVGAIIMIAAIIFIIDSAQPRTSSLSENYSTS